MSFDNEEKFAAATTTPKQPVGLRSFLAEILAVGMIVSVASVVWTLIEIKKVVSKVSVVDGQILTISHSIASLADRTTARLEKVESARNPAPAEPVDSTPPVYVDIHSHPPSKDQQPPKFQLHGRQTK